MKVLQVLFSGLGGHGSVAFSLVRGDREQRHAHQMLFFGVELLAPGYEQLCAELGVQHAVVIKRRGLDVSSWVDVVSAFERLAPEIIVLHSMTLIAPAVAYARARRIPLIAVDHLSNQIKTPRAWASTAIALVAAQRTVTLTPEFAAELQVRLRPLFRRDRVEVIGNGIDLAAFSPAKAETNRTMPLRVGMHSRFSPSKDHATLLRAAALCPNILLRLAGDGETLTELRALANTLRIEDRTEFLGMLPETDLPQYLRSLDVYVQSSTGETMSTSVMQAMATGLPVIASDVRGLHTMVRPGVTGELFPCGDADALASLLRRMEMQPETRRSLGAAAITHARANWSQEAMFQRYDAVFSSLVTSGASTSMA